MIKRSVGFNAPSHVKLTLFNSLCRSHLEYSSQVWSPFNKNKILLLESVQRSMTRFILNNDLSYPERCAILNILPLSFRREICDLVFLFKYFKGFINVDFNSFIEVSSTNVRQHSGPTVRCPSRARTETFINSYFHRVSRLWNILPNHIRSSTSVAVFRNNLLLHYQTKMISYSVQNTCTLTSTCRCTGFYHF